MTDYNINEGKNSLALAILADYVRHGIECSSARNHDCDCGLQWHLDTVPWLRKYLPPKVLRAIEYREGKQ